MVCRGGVIPARLNRDVTGPIARTVTDVAILFEAMIGHDAQDGLTELALSVRPCASHHSQDRSNHMSKGTAGSMVLPVIAKSDGL